MRPILFPSSARLRLAAVVLALLSVGATSASDRNANGPVVLELFTSQGCSSCPPADALLRELGAREDVVALSFHVDYWNRLGWRDPYSHPSWSMRQEEYVRALGGDTLYTPQLVINGSHDVVGSDRHEISESLRDAVEPPTRIEMQVEATPGGVRVTVAAQQLPGRTELTLFVAENGIETEVSRGENARRTLRHDHVVRHAARHPRWSGDQVSFDVEPEDDWSRGALELVALAQNASSRRVLAVGRLDWP